jgi:hypothetical protein
MTRTGAAGGIGREGLALRGSDVSKLIAEAPEPACSIGARGRAAIDAACLVAQDIQSGDKVVAIDIGFYDVAHHQTGHVDHPDSPRLSTIGGRQWHQPRITRTSHGPCWQFRFSVCGGMRELVMAPSWESNSGHFATCAQCGCISSPHWVDWGAYRVDEPDSDDPPELAFFCPSCAAREFGYRVQPASW